MTLAATAGEIKAFTRRAKGKYLFALGKRFDQMILRLVGGVFTSVSAEHAFELALLKPRIAPRTLRWM